MILVKSDEEMSLMGTSAVIVAGLMPEGLGAFITAVHDSDGLQQESPLAAFMFTPHVAHLGLPGVGSKYI